MNLVKAPSLREFARVIWEDWGSRVSGGLSVPFTVMALFSKADYAKAIWGALAVIGVLATLYQVWSKERKRVVDLQAELNAEADMQGTIWVNILQYNPFEDQTKPGSGLTYTCDCANHGRNTCEISKILLTLTGLDEEWPQPFRLVNPLPPLSIQTVAPGKSFRLENYPISLRGVKQSTLRRCGITIQLIDSLGTEYQNTVTRIVPSVPVAGAS